MGILNFPFFRRSGKNHFGHLKALENQLKYRFFNRSILDHALTHSSLLTEHGRNYERLEFLGDAIIDQEISKWLYEHYPDADEGELTRMRSALVNRQFLSKIGEDLELKKFIKVNPGVDLNNSKTFESIIGDVFESITGAIYLDGGVYAVQKFILNTLIIKHTSLDLKYNSNYKGQLVEFCHSKGLVGPIFKIIHTDGPQHSKEFTAQVEFGKGLNYRGTGNSKKEAEQNSAKMALTNLDYVSTYQ